MGSGYALKTLRPRHHEIIRLAFQGLNTVQIAGQVSCSVASVRMILRSPIAKAELARLQASAEEKLCDTPAKVRVMAELQGFGVEAVRLRRRLMNDEGTDIKVREKISAHAMDRIVFNKDDDDDKVSVRDLLRQLDNVAERMGLSMSQPKPVVIDALPVSSEEVA